jgi:Protein of unknown function (DUF2877)
MQPLPQPVVNPAAAGAHAVAAGIGPIAARALRQGASGSVRAVFERCFYVELDSGWACVGAEGLGAGPLNLVCARWPSGPLAAQVRGGDVAQIDAATLSAGGLAIALGAELPWVPERVGPWTGASLSRGLAATEAAVRATAPRAGLALPPVETSGLRPALWSALDAPLAHLEQLLGTPPAATPPIEIMKIVPLLGLGPGLTPSGDDYLGGLFLALSLVGRSGLRDRLWQAMQPFTAVCTTAISRVHLAAAAEGFGSAALHDVLGATLCGSTERIAAACAGLARVGHSSGWDGLAGALAVLRATLRAS